MTVKSVLLENYSLVECHRHTMTVKTSRQCYSVLSTLAQVLKILAFLSFMPQLSQTFESHQRVKIYTYNVNDLSVKIYLQ